MKYSLVRPLDMIILRVFGSLCFTKYKLRTNDKFASRSCCCIFIGYPFGKKGWRVDDLDKEEYFVSRDVIFYENNFPFTSTQYACVHDDVHGGPSYFEDDDFTRASVPLAREYNVYYRI